MGSYDIRCSLTGVPITPYDKYFYCLLVAPYNNNGDCPVYFEVAHSYTPFLPPFKAKYLDYGHFEMVRTNIGKEFYNKVLREKSDNKKAEVEDVCDREIKVYCHKFLDVAGGGVQLQKELRPVSVYAIHKDVYEAIIEKHDPVNYLKNKLMSPAEIAAEESLKVFYDFCEKEKDTIRSIERYLWEPKKPEDVYLLKLFISSAFPAFGKFEELFEALRENYFHTTMPYDKEFFIDLANFYRFMHYLRCANKTIIPYGLVGGQDQNWEEIKMLADIVSNLCEKKTNYDPDQDEGDEDEEDE